MRRDLEDLVTAIVDCDRSLYLLNFPTTGWFGDRTVALVERILRRGIGRLMTTISIDGPPELHDAMRGLPGSWERGIDTLRRLRAIERRNFQVVAGMTLFARNASCVDATIAAIRAVVPGLRAHGSPPEHRPRIGALLRQRRVSRRFTPASGRRGDRGAPHRDRQSACIPCDFSKIAIRRSSAATTRPTSLRCPCTALASSCFIDPYWELYPCSIWDQSLGNLRDCGFDLSRLWESHADEGRAHRGQERAVSALLDAVRGVPHHSRQSGEGRRGRRRRQPAAGHTLSVAPQKEALESSPAAAIIRQPLIR